MKTIIPKSSQNIVPVLQQFKSDLQKLYGERFEKLILYGSYTRGNQHTESDIDLLLILNGMTSASNELYYANELITNYLLDYELLFSIIPTTADKFENMPNPLYYNIKREGVFV